MQEGISEDPTMSACNSVLEVHLKSHTGLSSGFVLLTITQCGWCFERHILQMPHE